VSDRAFCCPCCGHRTLPLAPSGTGQLCEVCCWEDRITPRPTGGLAMEQASFEGCGACDPDVVELARPPRPDEARPPWWFSLADAAAVLGAEIDASFEDVRLDGGVSLEEAEKIDDYELPARTASDPSPPGFEDAPPWQSLTDADLAAFHWCNFSFQDGRGLRYHLPAYMHYFLRRSDGPIWEGSLVFTLRCGHQLDELWELLTAGQRRVVARFLAWLAADPADPDGDDARAALRERWAGALDPDQARRFGA